jgi:CheY-like chemotaxis protein
MSRPNLTPDPRGPRRGREARRHFRENVTWPVALDVGDRCISAETMNVTPLGVKLRLGERLPLGAEVHLKASPPDRPPFEMRAIVWRIDPDGAALLFLGTRNTPIPVALRPLQPSSEAAGQRALPAGTETILLVDEDIGTRVLARGALEAQGYTVLDAGVDPRQAVRIAREHTGPIHMLITDVVTPLTNGLHLVERVLPLRPSMRVVLMSAHSESATRSHGDRYLPKPFTVDDLCHIVRDTLDARSLFAPSGPPDPRA